MKQWLKLNKLCFLLWLLTAVCLAACASPETPADSAALEAPVTVTTSEPTPTTAVCTSLADDMTIDVQFESDRHGIITVAGLQTGEKPMLLLTGEETTAKWHQDAQSENAVAADGRFQYKFDFRSWPSIGGYEFKGQLIHQRGVACFAIDLPLTDEPMKEGRTINGRLIAAEDETRPVPGVLLRLEPEGEPVAQTDVNGRFTIQNAPLTALRLYAQRLDTTIPAGAETTLDLGDIAYPPLQSLMLPLADYSPNSAPYWIEEGDFWLSHTPQGQLFAFAPLSPTYAEAIDGDECRYTWDQSQQRFVDPCSGDEWELNGAFNLAHSSESGSYRDLDQYAVIVIEELISVQFSPLVPSLPVDEPPLAIAAQYGVTVTAVTANFSPTATTIDTVSLVDPLWQMDPAAFPPQQALTYFTMPDSLLDDQGRSTFPTGRDGEKAVFDSSTGGLRQLMHNDWDSIATDARTVTATMTIELLNLYRQLSLPLDWDNHQVGEVWDVDVPLEIGYAAAHMQQIEWVEILTDEDGDGSARLRLTITDASPADIRLYCLHLDASNPEERTCPNFDGDLIYTVDVQPGEPVVLHLWAALELKRPFALVLDVGQ